MSEKINAVCWFEIPVTDLQRAKAFYEYVFDVQLSLNEMSNMKMAMFPWLDNAPGTAGSLMQGENYEPCKKGTVVYFTVPNIDVLLTKISQRGGKTLLPKMSIGEYGWIAHFEDTEGNRVALHSVKA
jgi:uncharacterized protein